MENDKELMYDFDPIFRRIVEKVANAEKAIDGQDMAEKNKRQLSALLRESHLSAIYKAPNTFGPIICDTVSRYIEEKHRTAVQTGVRQARDRQDYKRSLLLL